MSKPVRLALLILTVMALIELFVVARLVAGVFDPRCLLPKGYIVAHTYTKGREDVRCVPDTP